MKDLTSVILLAVSMGLLIAVAEMLATSNGSQIAICACLLIVVLLGMPLMAVLINAEKTDRERA
jgi:hypothetical protein